MKRKKKTEIIKTQKQTNKFKFQVYYLSLIKAKGIKYS